MIDSVSLFGVHDWLTLLASKPLVLAPLAKIRTCIRFELLTLSVMIINLGERTTKGMCRNTEFIELT